MQQPEPEQEELISSATAQAMLGIKGTKFYRLLERENIGRIVHPTLSNKGMYKRADIERLKTQIDQFEQKYKIVG